MKKGVSLIILVIVIVIMLILATIIINSLVKNNPIEDANMAQLKTDMKTMLENQEIRYNDLLFVNNGDVQNITDDDFEGVIPEKYQDEYIATVDGVEYIGDDENIKKVAREMGIIVK